jgi:alkylated DNA repair dioxygenase AlkB
VPRQPSLFADAEPVAPDGFRYRADLVDRAEEQALMAAFAGLPFKPFEFHGHLGLRQVVSFGCRYDYGRAAVPEAPPIPDILLPLRERAAAFAERPADAFEHVLINRYDAGAGIGWHRDRPSFDQVVGVSLGAPCDFRFRRARPDGWDRITRRLEPRSAYLLDGPARWEWEHSIATHDQLRYSVTFRVRRA